MSFRKKRIISCALIVFLVFPTNTYIRANAILISPDIKVQSNAARKSTLNIRKTYNKNAISIINASSKLKNATENIKDELYNYNQSIDLDQYELTRDEVTRVMEYILYSNPDLFYVNVTYNVKYTILGHVTKLTPSYLYAKDKLWQKKDEFTSCIENFKTEVKKEWSDLEKVIYIHEYICKNVDFDNSYSKYDAYSALVEGKAVCQGYSLAFLALARAVGIESSIVTSASLNHSWNLVKVNGKYYNVDTTWDDPVYAGYGNVYGELNHTYFLKSTSYYKNADGKHNSSDWYVQGDLLPTIADNEQYDEYVWDNINSPLEYYEGKWYSISSDYKKIMEFSCTGNGLKPEGYVDNVSTITEKVDKTVGAIYTGLGSYDDDLYIAEAYSGIYKLNTKRKNTCEQLTTSGLNDNKYYIYALNVNRYGEIYYTLKEKNRPTPMPSKLLMSIDTSDYKINYILNGGTNNANNRTEFKVGTNTFELKAPQKKGYQFGGWYLEKDFKTSINSIAKGHSGDISVYAKWLKEYSITYHLNGGKNNVLNTHIYSELDNVKLKTPTRKGYKFCGWYSDKKYSKKVSEIKKGTKGNIKLYAKWKKQ